jgi:hypothetical protein
MNNMAEICAICVGKENEISGALIKSPPPLQHSMHIVFSFFSLQRGLNSLPMRIPDGFSCQLHQSSHRIDVSEAMIFFFLASKHFGEIFESQEFILGVREYLGSRFEPVV